MRFVSDNRASRILYNLLVSNEFEKPFLLPANVCAVIPKVFEEAGVKTEFVDIDSSLFCIDINHFLSKLDHYSGVLFVHTYGVEFCNEFYFKKIKQLCPSFVIIDDRCLCTPSIRVPNTSADVCLYSVGEKKQVDLGRGGYAFLQNWIRYQKCTLHSQSFMDDSTWAFDSGVIFEKTQEAKSHRELINSVYYSLLPQTHQFDSIFQNWRFNIFVDNKQVILDAIFNEGLFASSHYCPIVTDCFWANELQNHVINLFNDYHFSKDMAIEICRVINNIL